MVNLNSKKFSFFDVVNAIFLGLFGFSTLYPFIYLLFVSLSPIEELMKGGIMLFPKVISLESYTIIKKI